MRNFLAYWGYLVLFLLIEGVIYLFDMRVMHTKWATSDTVIASTAVLLRAIVGGRSDK